MIVHPRRFRPGSRAARRETEAVQPALPRSGVLTITEAARLIGWSRTTTWERCKDGTLPSVTIGTRIYLKRQELIDSGWIVA
jgi:excisionase family DNA binding protein